MKRRFALAAACLALASPAGGQTPEAVKSFGPDAAPVALVVRGTTDIPVFAPALEGFVAATPGLRVEYEQWASNDLYEATAEACRDGAAAADLVISSAIDLQVKLVNDGCALTYRSEATAALSASARWRDEVFGVTSEPAVIIYNRDLVPPDEAPRSRFDLLDLLRPADTRYAGRIATYDIEASGLGYMLAVADSQQATTFGSLLEAFGRAGVETACCSSDLVDGVATGRYLVAYNVLGPYALARAEEDPSIVVVAPSDYTLILSRAVLIPRHARESAAAGRFIDYLLSPEGRAALEEAYLIFDVTGGGAEDRLVFDGATTSLRPLRLSPILLVGLDQHKRERFLRRWRAALGID